jgi:hypothetical protein
MRLLTLTVATATVLTFAFSQTPRVLAQGRDDGAVGRPLQLDGGPSLGSSNRGQISGRSEGAEPSAGHGSEKTQTEIEKTGESKIHGRSHTHVGWSSLARHRFVFHRRGHHVFALHVPRHPFVIHRYGRRFVAFNEPSGV